MYKNLAKRKNYITDFNKHNTLRFQSQISIPQIKTGYHQLICIGKSSALSISSFLQQAGLKKLPGDLKKLSKNIDPIIANTTIIYFLYQR